MEWKGIKLKEITESQVFDPPKEMLVWDDETSSPDILRVYAIGPSSMTFRVRTISDSGRSENATYQHCADIPEEPNPRRATVHELAKWLAEGKGEAFNKTKGRVYTSINYDPLEIDLPVDEDVFVCKWEDKKYVEPTSDYMGLEE